MSVKLEWNRFEFPLDHVGNDLRVNQSELIVRDIGVTSHRDSLSNLSVILPVERSTAKTSSVILPPYSIQKSPHLRSECLVQAWSEVEKAPFWTDVQHEAHKVEEAGKHLWSDIEHTADGALKDVEAFAAGFKQDFESLQKPMRDVISSTTSLHKSLSAGEVSLPALTDALSILFDGIVRELEVMSPPPSEAPGHDERQAAWDHAMATLGDATVGLLVDKFHLPANEMREHWNAISAAKGSVLFTVVDLAVQHPDIVKIAVGILIIEAVVPLTLQGANKSNC
ncbi:hypothetical protein BDZ89DRAFT_1161718 [Hymenopellis radicata]|nr:hypothetical protein BDZ89DRAFT_1161718 [Hymenopellis radicata]